MHNNKGLALANSLSAVTAGASCRYYYNWHW